MNEVEIVITSKNKTKPGMEEARRDGEKLGKTYQETSKRAVSAFAQVRDMLRHGLHDAIADVHGETNRMSRAFRAVQESATASFDRIKADVRSKLRGLVTSEDGKSIGRRIASGIGGGLAAGLKGSLGTPILGPIIIAALGAAALGGGMTLASILSGAIISGLGVGLVGAGAAALFHVEEVNSEWSKAEQKRVKESNRQAERLRAQWRETTRDIVGGLRSAAQPLVPVFDTVRSTLRDVGREFQPVLKQGFEIAKGPLQRFVKSLGEAFKELKPAIVPVMTAFGALLDQTGPALPGVFDSIADSVIELAGIVNENRDLISSVFLGLLASLPLVIGLLGNMTSAFRGSLLFVMGLLDGLLGAMQAIMGGIAKIPGPWQKSAAEVAASLAGTRADLAGLRADVENFPEQVRLEGEISDLEGKIATAKARLKDPKLTRPERSKIRAEISDLQAKVAQAKAALASIQGRTATTFIDTIYRYSGKPRVGSGTVLAPGLARGGVVGGVKRFADGGVAGAGSSLAMVGEQGPELVRLPVGSTVTPAGQTRARMDGGGNGFGSISMAFRQAGGDSAGSLAGSMRDLTKVLRDVISLREGMSKFTDSMFGQSRALIAYEAAWDSVKKSLKDNGRTLNITTAKGRENRESLLSLADAAHQVAFAMRDMGKPTSAIVAKMKEQRAEFIKAARSFGLSAAQAKKVADAYGLIPSKVKSVLTKEKADLAYNKAAEAFNARLDGKAAGGVAGGVTLVGERGPEIVRLPYGSSVTSANQTAAMMAGGPMQVQVVLEVQGGRAGNNLESMFVQMIRHFVHVHGGDVQGAFGQGRYRLRQGQIVPGG